MSFLGKKYLYKTINGLFIISAASSTFSASAASLTTHYNHSVGYSLASILTVSNLIKIWGFDITREESEEPSDGSGSADSEDFTFFFSYARSKLCSLRVAFFSIFTTTLVVSSFNQWVDILFLWQATKAWIKALEKEDTPPVVSLGLVGNIFTSFIFIIPLSLYYATSQVEIHHKLSAWLSPRSDVMYYSFVKKYIKPMVRSLTFRFSFRVITSLFDTLKQLLSLTILLPPLLVRKLFSRKETAVSFGIASSSLLLFLGLATYSQVFFVDGNTVRKNFEKLVHDHEPQDYSSLKKLPIMVLKLTTLFLFLTPPIVGLSTAMPILKYMQFVGLPSYAGYLIALAPAIIITIQQDVMEASRARTSVRAIIKSKVDVYARGDSEKTPLLESSV